MKKTKELLKEFVSSQHFTSTIDIMNSMKELFSDVLQTVMEAELGGKGNHQNITKAACLYLLRIYKNQPLAYGQGVNYTNWFLMYLL